MENQAAHAPLLHTVAERWALWAVWLEFAAYQWLHSRLEARTLLGQLEGYRERDREIMEPDFIAAIDEFGWSFQRALTLFRLQHEPGSGDPRAADRIALLSLIRGARSFAAVLARYAPEWMELPAIMREGARSHSEQIRALRDRRIWDE